MAFRYEKLRERQKDLEQKINGRISNDIRNVQQTLEYLATKRQQIRFVPHNNIVQKINEENEQPNDEKMDTYSDYKKADLYASLLMYNSY